MRHTGTGAASRRWNRQAVLLTAAVLLGLACSLCAEAADGRFVTAPLAACLDSPGLPAAALAAAWAGPVLGGGAVAVLPVLLWTGSRGSRGERPLLVPLLQTMVTVGLLCLAVEAMTLHDLLPHVGPHHARCL
ncbi:hypothetical protein AB0442_25420 [Kitasatospora sp. NPDC085895]|uniref:hypothetical protein n=1 Tax=Kitasatospora sp. NPDC085895 TaxID=3155057 RepID=UPI00344C8397